MLTTWGVRFSSRFMVDQTRITRTTNATVSQGERVAINSLTLGPMLLLLPVYMTASWGSWPWNPIGAGDIAGNSGQVLAIQNTSTQALITTVPLQWACVDVPCECEFVQNVTLAPGATWLTVLSTISNHRSDLKDYGAFGRKSNTAALRLLIEHKPHVNVITLQRSCLLRIRLGICTF